MKTKMAYAAYLGYLMRERDEEVKYDDVLTMDKIAEIALNHEFTLDEEGLIDSESFYNDADEDVERLFDDLNAKEKNSER